MRIFWIIAAVFLVPTQALASFQIYATINNFTERVWSGSPFGQRKRHLLIHTDDDAPAAVCRGRKFSRRRFHLQSHKYAYYLQQRYT
jgi:hypothetical protein